LVSFADNLWNATDTQGFLSNQTITSTNGNSVFQTRSNISAAQYYYGFQTRNLSYFEPLDLHILMNESTLSGTGVLVQLGIQVVGNGSGSIPEPVYWFDNITIHDPQVQNAFYYIAGNDSTPIGTFYDAELVFCGEGNLESTTFSQMNSTLGLFFHNESSGQLSAFPSYYSFGGDTGEATYNLNVTYSGNGIAQVGVGNPNYVYLNSAQITTTNSANPTSQTSSTSSTSLTSQASINSSTQSSTTTNSSASSGSSATTILNSDYLIVPSIVIFVIFVGGVVYESRKNNPV